MAGRAFAYTALDMNGAKRKGVIEADDKDAAVARLASEGRFVVEIKAAEAAVMVRENHTNGHSGRRPSRQDLALFTRRLADLARAGLPLDRVLGVIIEQSENGVLRAVTNDALADVRSGLPVSQALAKHPKLFPEMFTQTLRAGEASGQFPETAARLADLQEKEVARRSQIVSALVYPTILAFTALTVITFLMTFVIPRLSDVFKDLGDALPFTTKLLMSTADLLVSKWPIIVGAVVVGVIVLRGWLATAAGQRARDRIFLRAPILGPVTTKATVSRFSRVLGTLIYGGVPILEALELAGLASGNRLFIDSARALAAEVREGRPMAQAMSDAGEFPPVLVHMVAIGEETGDLPQMLERVCESLDFEVDTGMRRLISLVEPIIVLSMGTFVGFVVVSVMLPIFQAQSLVK